MVITKLYNGINQLYERYRELKAIEETKQLIDYALYLSSELIEMIEKYQTDEKKNN